MNKPKLALVPPNPNATLDVRPWPTYPDGSPVYACIDPPPPYLVVHSSKTSKPEKPTS